MTHLREIFTYFIMWSAIIAFCFTLFRFRLNTCRQQLFFTIVIMTQAGYFVPLYQLQSFRVLIYTLVLFICILVFFRIYWLHAAIMVLASYAFCECSLSLIKIGLAGLDYEQHLLLAGPLSLWNRLLFALYIYTVTWLIYRFRFGFTFIASYSGPKPERMPLWMKLTLALGTFSICIRVLSLFVWERLLPLDLGVIFLLFFIMFYLFYKKETSE